MRPFRAGCIAESGSVSPPSGGVNHRSGWQRAVHRGSHPHDEVEGVESQTVVDVGPGKSSESSSNRAPASPCCRSWRRARSSSGRLLEARARSSAQASSSAAGPLAAHAHGRRGTRAAGSRRRCAARGRRRRRSCRGGSCRPRPPRPRPACRRSCAGSDAGRSARRARDRGGRVAEVEARDLATVHLAHDEGVGPSCLQRERIVDAAHQHDLARAAIERIRRRAEGTEDVNDDCEPARCLGAVEKAQSSNLGACIIRRVSARSPWRIVSTEMTSRGGMLPRFTFGPKCFTSHTCWCFCGASNITRGGVDLRFDLLDQARLHLAGALVDADGAGLAAFADDLPRACGELFFDVLHPASRRDDVRAILAADLGEDGEVPREPLDVLELLGA